MDKNIPYNELPLISTIYVEESMELLRLAEDTRVALSVLDDPQRRAYYAELDTNKSAMNRVVEAVWSLISGTNG
jgi:hypothetical protein